MFSWKDVLKKVKYLSKKCFFYKIENKSVQALAIIIDISNEFISRRIW